MKRTQYMSTGDQLIFTRYMTADLHYQNISTLIIVSNDMHEHFYINNSYISWRINLDLIIENNQVHLLICLTYQR